MTPEMILLVSSLTDIALREILRRVQAMTPEQVSAELDAARARSRELMAELNAH